MPTILTFTSSCAAALAPAPSVSSSDRLRHYITCASYQDPMMSRDNDDDIDFAGGTMTNATTTTSTSTTEEDKNSNDTPSHLLAFLDNNSLVFEREVLPLLSSTDRGLLARTSHACKAVVEVSGLAADGKNGMLFELERLIGSVPLIRWAEDNLEDLSWEERGLIYYYATVKGDVEALERVVAMGYSWDGYNDVICKDAATCGHINVLKWAREEQDCTWGPNICVDATFGGRLEILKYARSAGCPWDKGYCASIADRRFGETSEIYRWIIEQPE